MKKILKDYFTFSRKERSAFIILLLLIVIFIVLPYFIPIKKTKPIINAALQQQLAKLTDSTKNSDGNIVDETIATTATESAIKFELFEFNPNTIEAVDWKKLGLRDKTINTILNYRNKGGKFRTAEDIRKIWGLRKEDADRLIPYIRIENNSNAYHSQNKKIDNKKSTVIDINTATLEQFFSLPGIDHSLPYRIIKFREKLGGFLTVQQVKETYGMTDSIFQLIQPYLKVEIATIKKINLNTADDYALSMHPYITKDIAKAIVIYRTQHGAYAKVEDIKKIVFIKEDVFQKIAPYLTVE